MAVTSKAKEFFEIIEELVWKHDISYIDAVVLHCEKNKIELESVIPLIKNNSTFKGKIQIEAENLNILPKSSRLDI